jgi:hypothetical protein
MLPKVLASAHRVSEARTLINRLLLAGCATRLFTPLPHPRSSTREGFDRGESEFLPSNRTKTALN